MEQIEFDFVKDAKPLPIGNFCNKVLQGDCIELLKKLPDGSVDLVVTDPPYNSQAVEWDKKDDTFQIQWLTEVKRVMKDGASLYTFFAPLNMYLVEGYIRNAFTLKNVGVWYHSNLYGSHMSYGKDRYKSSWDVVFYAVKGERAKHKNNISQVSFRKTGRGLDVFDYPQPRPLLHKAQKPLALIKKFIICSSEEGDIVLDPFVGCGTTVKAAKELNRQFIGMELDLEFYKTAQKVAEAPVSDRSLDRLIKVRND